MNQKYIYFSSTQLALVVCCLLMGPPATAQTHRAVAGGQSQSEVASHAKPPGITFRLLSRPDGTWGYDIIMDGKVMIHQPSVPGLQGNKGFRSKATAGKVAALVIRKIKRGEMPPTITMEDLKKLNVE